ncbi:hypothetical protein HBH56_000750 [Parastagonospora nodorum]|nr:hypothetical protein HBH56_000750 [Parastagonospora nodorum]QRC90077.1 hypothetical protein JI435_400100 [Parastagonospora nodorum SN15]KAH3938257.1 hypothetical protein HBH54_000760 [Parastagonospora nodorum]KAH4145553.1 hypothetical protein HBH45_011760 [Parastagonospora nodorum]KAH4164264.1 hypothetical protein HBH44_072720 [Parastagonospora nodorum]
MVSGRGIETAAGITFVATEGRLAMVQVAVRSLCQRLWSGQLRIPSAMLITDEQKQPTEKKQIWEQANERRDGVRKT